MNAREPLTHAGAASLVPPGGARRNSRSLPSPFHIGR